MTFSTTSSSAVSLRLLFAALLASGCTLSGPDASPDGALPPAEAVVLRLSTPAEVDTRLKASGIAVTGFGSEVREAVQYHPDIERGQFLIAAGQADREGNASVYRPQVSLGAEALANSSGGGVTTSAAPVLRVSQLVFDGGAGRYAARASEERVAATQADFAVAASEVAFRAVDAKISLWRARQLDRVATERLTEIDRFLAQAEQRLNAGVGTESELTLGRSRLADARARQIEVSQMLAVARADHTEVFGGPSTAIAGLPPIAPRTSGLGSPRLVAMDFAVNAAIYNLEQVRAQRLPGISAGLSARPDSAPQGGLRAELGVSYALSSGGARAAAVREAEALLNATRAERDGLVRQIGRAASNARSASQASGQRVSAARLSVQAAEAALATAKEQFSIGRSDLTVALDAQRDLSQARESLVIAQAEQVRQSYLALSITGEILPLFDIPLPLGPSDLTDAE